MGKVSSAGKMKIQTLYDQGYRGKALVDAYPLTSRMLRSLFVPRITGSGTTVHILLPEASSPLQIYLTQSA